ncbi:hypothetical protein CY35_10G031100 [Sphagnum magellanicum]|nr:hypothetical protein CY35_10G031100 [Sphagnum magellanicum]KAH9549664.1 hypothetical protein CY35_10G031100 [Sphagnum magellanicum]KAH9549665.1 hypothetical protein CY35_10G031100 [Sphagnum magellanicum]
MAMLSRGRSFVESFLGDSPLNDLFGGKIADGGQMKGLERSPSRTRKWIKELSSLANVVVGHCARILLLHPEELQRHFEEEAPLSAKHPSCYARNLLEYCCFQALSVAVQVTDHLSDKEFRRLSFDMMLAWELPSATSRQVAKNEQEYQTQHRGPSVEDDEDAGFFYSGLTPMMVNVESTVGLDAFVRLAPAIPTVADAITVHCQFDALTASTASHLPFAIYDKYLTEIDKSIKTMKGQVTQALVKVLQLGRNETVIDIDGTATTQPVLQHIGVSTWPGRLTLTDHAFYFEATGVVSYDKAKKFDLSADLKHVVKPDLTGPWGARLFDKAVMYKSNVTIEPVVLEFPELTGCTRRDYWLAIIREVIAAHQFIRTFQLEGVGKAEALAKAVLGIARLRATRETSHVLPPKPETLLTYSWGEEMPSGDLVLAALADTLHHPGGVNKQAVADLDINQGGRIYANSAASIVASFGSSPLKGVDKGKEASVPIGEVLIGEMTPLEKAIVQSRDNSKRVMLAQATIEGVRVEGIGTNLAVLKELLSPLTASITWLQSVLVWEEPLKSITFCVIVSYIIYRGWLAYIPPLLLASMAGSVAYFRYMRKDEPIPEVLVSTPPGQNAVEQLLALQQALAQLEALIQASNIMLLKTRALLLSAFPEATNQIIMLLLVCTAALLLLPLKWLVLISFLNLFTSLMPARLETTVRFNRRLSEWWYSIPVVPVRFLKPGEVENIQQ